MDMSGEDCCYLPCLWCPVNDPSSGLLLLLRAGDDEIDKSVMRMMRRMGVLRMMRMMAANDRLQ